MKFPKTLLIGGVNWKVIIDKKINGGAFWWHTHTIKIEKTLTQERKFNILIHEICEIIMVNNIMRYQKGLDGEKSNGDYIFSFDHDRFMIFTEELSGILKQFIEI